MLCWLIYMGDDIVRICYMRYVKYSIKIRVDDCVVIIYYSYVIITFIS